MERISHLRTSATLAPRLLAWLAWSLCALSLSLQPVILTLGMVTAQQPWRLLYIPSVVAGALVGGLVAARRPANPIGWLFLANACLYSCYGLGYAYGFYATAAGLPPSPLTAIAAVAANLSTGSALLITVLPLYFPTGGLLSPAWRPVARANALILALVTVVYALRPQAMSDLPAIDNPLAIAALAPLWPTVDALASLMLVVGSAAALVGAAVRYRKADSVERRQMTWLIFATTAFFSLVLVAWAIYVARPGLGSVLVLELLIGLAYAAIPVAAGVAVLRYNLYAIDSLVDRTLLYGPLTAAVIAIYALLVGYLGTLLGNGRTFVVSAVATAIVAALFQPLRAALQRGVNRLLYGRRDDPRAVIAALGRQLEGALAADVVLPTIVQIVARELKLPYAAVVLDDRDEPAAASVGSPAEPLLALPLADAGVVIGRLFVAARSPREPFTPRERQLLEDLSRQAGVAVRAARLNHELQRSRERLVAAREEERRRLQRDLHDELGPTLASLSMQLDAARGLLRADLDLGEAILLEMQGQLKETVGTVRQIVHQLRPPLLDQLGLVGAVRECALRLERSGGLTVRLELPPSLPSLSAAVEAAAYYIIAEALHNAARHAGAPSCTVRLTAGTALLIEVMDDGAGLPPGIVAGVGLRSMRERAEELGGMWELAATGDGTTIRARLPLATLRGASAQE